MVDLSMLNPMNWFSDKKEEQVVTYPSVSTPAPAAYSAPMGGRRRRVTRKTKKAKSRKQTRR